MHDLYVINFAKTEFREAFNTYDRERLITLLDPEVVYMPDGLDPRRGLAPRTLFACNFENSKSAIHVQLQPISMS